MEEHIHQRLTPTHPSTYLHKHSHIHISMYTHTHTTSEQNRSAPGRIYEKNLLVRA